MLAEEWKLKYGGKAVTYQDYADVVTSYDSTKIAKLRAFEGHISDNFLKVAKYFLFICIDFILLMFSIMFDHYKCLII